LEYFFNVLVSICTYYGAPAVVSTSLSNAEPYESPAPCIKQSERGTEIMISSYKQSMAKNNKIALSSRLTWEDVTDQIDPFWKPLLDAGILVGLRNLLIPV